MLVIITAWKLARHIANERTKPCKVWPQNQDSQNTCFVVDFLSAFSQTYFGNPEGILFRLENRFCDNSGAMQSSQSLQECVRKALSAASSLRKSQTCTECKRSARFEGLRSQQRFPWDRDVRELGLFWRCGLAPTSRACSTQPLGGVTWTRKNFLSQWRLIFLTICF